jgi:hypothetical protein
MNNWHITMSILALWASQGFAADLQPLLERRGPGYFRQEVWAKSGTLSDEEVDEYIKGIVNKAGNAQLIQIRFYDDPRERWGRAYSPHQPYAMTLHAARGRPKSAISEVLMIGKSGVQRTWVPGRAMITRVLGEGDPLLLHSPDTSRTFRIIFLQFWPDPLREESGSREFLEIFLTGNAIPNLSQGESVFKTIRSMLPPTLLAINIAPAPWFPFSMYFPASFPLTPERPPSVGEYLTWPVLRCDDYHDNVACTYGR